MKTFYSVLVTLTVISACAGRTLRAPVLTQITTPVLHAEGPFWDLERGVLFYVDISLHKIHQWDPATNQVTFVDIGGEVGFAIPVDGGNGDQFIAGRYHDLVYVTWSGDSNVTIPYENLVPIATADTEDHQAGNRFNDAKADVSGRLWAGTMGNDGSLYSLDPTTNDIVQKISGVATSNGIAWNSDNTIMYYIDSPTRKVDALDFDLVTGVISGRRTIFDMVETGLAGDPDGMTIDTDGNLWVALWGGQSVIQVDPTSTNHLLQQIPFPAMQVSSCAFGGDNLDTLFVTTSRAGLSDEQVAEQPLAGAVFKIEGLGVSGFRSNKVNREFILDTTF